MKKLILIVALMTILSPVSIHGRITQKGVQAIIEAAQSKRVSLNYDCVIAKDGTEIKLKGSLTAEGNCFIIKGNGLEVISDGCSVLTMDPVAKEAYLQKAESLEKFIMDNLSSVKMIDVSDVKTSPSGGIEDFRLPLETLSGDWIITEL